MLFNSFTYVIFLISVVLLHYLIPHRFRWVLLLAASCAFYMAWRPVLIILIIISTFSNFYISRKIHISRSKGNKKKLLIISLIINFGLLFIFKYLSLAFDTILYFWNASPVKDLDILLPVGISFYTFQAAGYTIDVYRGNLKPERNYFKFTLFIIFFPQLVAGPIERAESLMPQLFTAKKFNINNLITGGKYILIGLLKKIVIADRLAVLVDRVYNNTGRLDGINGLTEGYGGLAFIIATFLFAFQIYCDFGGYSDIAVGSAKFLGIDLMQNFRQPYLSGSTREFWRRWHISLSSWFKDYLYFPLGGNRTTRIKRYRNLMATFLVSGLWHGANWTFVIWGGLNGFLQVAEDAAEIYKIKILKRLHLDKVITFICICFTWIFFRANSIEDSFYIISKIFAGFPFTKQYVFNVLNSMGLSAFEVLISFGLVLFLFITDAFAGDENIYVKIEQRAFITRFAFYLILAVAVISLGVFYNAGQFIYFQF